MRKRLTVFLVVLTCALWLQASYDFKTIKSRISEFTLVNGLKFILLEDHAVPIASFVTYANVGSVDEHIGIYGISHILEHLAFKGTSEIGTTNYAEEKKTLDKMDAVFDQLLAAKAELNPDAARIAELDKQLKDLGEQAGKYVVTNELGTIIKKNGGVGLNAGTSDDQTVYFFSLPSNKLELWAYLESGRFSDPVFREFYKEKNVIMEERRMGDENQPVGKLIEQFLSVSFVDQPYRVGVVGPMSNLQHIRTRDVREYLNQFYGARNLTIGVAGDVTPAELKRVAEKYFAKLPAGQKNPGVFTIDPPAIGEKTVTLLEESQPWLIVGYHSTSSRNDDFEKFNVLNYLLTQGRSSRLNKRLTIDEKSALAVGSFSGFPGTKYPGLYLFFALPNSGHTTAELLKAIYEEIEKLKKEPVGEAELQSAKTRIKAQVLQGMKSRQGLLMQLLESEVLLGSWQKAFETLERVEKITREDIQKLVQTYLIEANRVIGRIESKGEAK